MPSKMIFSLVQTVLVFTILLFAQSSWADGPGDNIPTDVRPIPPIGIEVPEADKNSLLESVKKLQAAIAELQKEKSEQIQRYLPDVEIFSRAVEQALEFQEFYTPRDIANAHKQLEEGLKRAQALKSGSTPWTTQTGLVVRGYRSRIDQTVQPYGLEIPAHYQQKGDTPWRLDLWFHGRGEKITETAFIAQRMSQRGRYDAKETIVLHPFGRYCNAFKFAGEVDVLEALEHAQSQYRIDEDRISVRGFSMGGAGCWQMAVHYPDLFFAANPGAGFSETREFLNVFQNESLQPTWFEQKLWQMYDCPEYAANFYQLPLIAYSGEIDRQKQAADVMEKALAKEGLKMTHIIGPQTAHAIHKDSIRIIDDKMASLAKAGRNTVPLEIRFATPTLKYNRCHWLTVTGLQAHWEPARVEARLLPEEDRIQIITSNVTGLTLNFNAGDCPFSLSNPVTIEIISGQQGQAPQTITTEQPQILKLSQPQTDHSWQADLHLEAGQWEVGPAKPAGLVKKHNLQGPIDDAFMDSFLIVKPTGKGWHEQSDQWARSEMDRFIREWRKQFRGDARVIEDHQLTSELASANHLILFGDPASNSALKSISDQLPLKWSADELKVNGQTFTSAEHAPVMIYPNPQQPERYVVLNSGFTYREYAYLNNARQIPMLPDWAVIDLKTPPNSIWPGKVVEAGFFNEQWQHKENQPVAVK